MSHSMSTDIYIKIRSTANASKLVDELLRRGVPPEGLRIHGRTPPDVPVSRIPFRNDRQAFGRGLAWGIVAALATAVILTVFGIGLTIGLAILIALGALAGGVWAWQQNRARNRPLEPQMDALARGELILVAAVDDTAVGPIEERIAAAHPEVSVLGSDPAGSPPFP